MKKYVVYTHLNPIDNKVIYVGSGLLKRAYDFKNRNYIKWIKENGNPVVKIEKYFSEKKESLKYEEILTKKYKLKNEAIFNQRYGNTWDDENKLKLSKIHTGKKLNENWKKNISLSNSGEKNHFFGKKHSLETRKKISDKIKEIQQISPRLGKKHSDESKKKMSVSQKKSMTKERLLKMSLARLGKKPANMKKVICLNTGIIYKSTYEAAKKNNCSQSKVAEVCNKKYLKTKNLMFEFYEVKK